MINGVGRGAWEVKKYRGVCRGTKEVILSRGFMY